jgi:hypothetical protein
MSNQAQCNKPPPTVGDFVNNMDKLLRESGASEVCTKEADTWGTQMQTSGKVKVPFASAGFSASLSAFENSMNQKGCGQLFVSNQEISNKSYEAQCILNSSTQSVDTNISNVNNISIQSLPLTESEIISRNIFSNSLLETKQKMFDKLIEAISKLKAAGIDTSTFEKLLNSIDLNNNKDISDAVYKIYGRPVTINNSTFKQSIKINSKQQISLNNDQQQQLSKNAKAQAKQAAEATLAQKLGVNALTESQKQILNNTVENSSILSQENITKQMSSFSSSTDSSNTITISAPGPIILDNITLDQSVLASVAAELLMSTSSAVGVSAANSFVADQLAKGVQDSEVKGLEDLQDSLNRGIIGAIDATGGGGNSGLFIVIAVVVFILLMIGLLFFFGKTILNYIVPIFIISSLIVGIVYTVKKEMIIYIPSYILFVLLSSLQIYLLIKKTNK